MKPKSAKVALVTGAAKRVGAEIVRVLHAAGFDIALHYRGSAAEANALKTELETIRSNSVALFQSYWRKQPHPRCKKRRVQSSISSIFMLIARCRAIRPIAWQRRRLLQQHTL